jgi:hypothetical protein
MDTNKNNHTTSTKCQYKIPASNPRWWLFVKWYASTRHRPTAKNAVPIITCTNMYRKSSLSLTSTSLDMVQTMS